VTLVRDAPHSAPEPLPIVVSANADPTSAVLRLVLAALIVAGLLGVIALPVHDRVVGSAGPWPPGEYTAAAVCGGLVAFVSGIFWVVGLPVSWSVDAGGIIEEGPFGRRDLRWRDMRRIMPVPQGYEFYGKSAFIPITLRWQAVPKDRREAVRAGVEAVLREHFQFPPQPPMSITGALAWTFVVPAVVFGPSCASWWFCGRLISRTPHTILEWAWVQRLFAWSPDAARIVLCVVFIGPGLAYSALAACLICWKVIRDIQILPKRTGKTRDGLAEQSKSPGSGASGDP
jgi:hypothetical protein